MMLSTSATKAASQVGCTRKALSGLLHRKAGISSAMALERIGWSNAGFWMRQQASYELAQARRGRAAAERRAAAVHAWIGSRGSTPAWAGEPSYGTIQGYRSSFRTMDSPPRPESRTASNPTVHGAACSATAVPESRTGLRSASPVP